MIAIVICAGVFNWFFCMLIKISYTISIILITIHFILSSSSHSVHVCRQLCHILASILTLECMHWWARRLSWHHHDTIFCVHVRQIRLRDSFSMMTFSFNRWCVDILVEVVLVAFNHRFEVILLVLLLVILNLQRLARVDLRVIDWVRWLKLCNDCIALLHRSLIRILIKW